ncbi:DUF4936 family protein [Noviherbaspirillum sp.]|uniref:DUF4936 family protein n=1 Tax=Noviherbaspirillum sp. TaxID=1926288 RepID=UPI002B49F4ED|nr:DUF4936 family protein [Noviherbaspirillum sp.]HJV82727.1 DUF4936 family protein [Noviherbaspirillum sp.]
MDMYIYYRVLEKNAAALREQVAAVQGWASQEYGIVTGLKRRPEEKDGRQTWMEIYASVPSGFEATLERVVAQAGLAALIDGPRNTEFFVDISTCA